MFDVKCVWFDRDVKIKTNKKEERKGGVQEGGKEVGHETGYRGKKPKLKKDFLGP